MADDAKIVRSRDAQCSILTVPPLRLIDAGGKKMTSPAEEDNNIQADIQEIVQGDRNLRKRLKKDVEEVCRLLEKIYTPFGAPVNREKYHEVQSKLQHNFSEIYWCLKLHLAFHIKSETALKHEKLKSLGEKIGLTETELSTLPGKNHAIDPGSKVLETVSTQFSSLKFDFGATLERRLIQMAYLSRN